MKKIILLSLASVTLWSCNAEAETTEENNTNTEQTTDTTQVAPEVVEEEEQEAEVADFSKIEHYAIFTTKDMLVENFGAENIVDGSSWYGEGSLELQHSVLTNPSNGHVVKYVWQEENPTQLSSIEIAANVRNENFEIVSTQKIGSESGIFTGMTVQELKDWNGADFKFSGFGWDFHGNVYPGEGNKIANCGLSLTMDLNDDLGNSEYTELSGDVELSSADENVLNAPIILNNIVLYVK